MPVVGGRGATKIRRELSVRSWRAASPSRLRPDATDCRRNSCLAGAGEERRAALSNIEEPQFVQAVVDEALSELVVRRRRRAPRCGAEAGAE